MAPPGPAVLGDKLRFKITLFSQPPSFFTKNSQ